MTLNKWHNRPGGRWRVDHLTFVRRTGREDRCYAWKSVPMDAEGRGNAGDERSGYTRLAFLARLRAIAALKRMATANEGGR